MNEIKNEMLVQFPDGEWTTNVRTPPGLCAKIDAMLSQIHKSTKVKYSRNIFILKAIRYYFDHLIESKDIKELTDRIESVKIK